MEPWQAAGYDNPEDWKAAGWPAPPDPATGRPWEGWQMVRMERGWHPTGRKMADEDWKSPYTEHIFTFLRARRLYVNPLWDWRAQMQAKYPDYPVPGIYMPDLLRKAFPDWYEEEPAPGAPPLPTLPKGVVAMMEALGITPPGVPTIAPEALPTEAPPTPEVSPELQRWLGWARREEPILPGRPMPLTEEENAARRAEIRKWFAYLPPEKRAELEKQYPLAPEEEVPPEKPEDLITRLREWIGKPPVEVPILAEVPPTPEEELLPPTPPSLKRPWDMLWESLQRRPPTPQLITESIWTALNWLSPGFEERARIRLVDPTQEMAQIVTSKEALADEATTLLGEIDAAESIWPKLGEPPTEMRLPGLIERTVRGAYASWFDLVFGILKKGDDAKNIAFSIMARWSERHPIASLGAIGLSEEGFRPAMTPAEEEKQLGPIRQQLRGIISDPRLSREEIDEAVHEHEMLWSLLTIEPTFKNELRERVRTGEITWEEVMSNYRNDNLELAMNLITSPWWYAPSAPFEVAFAPITKPLALGWRGIKATPIINSLFEWSKRTRVEKYADEAATAFDRMMRRIPGWREMVPDASFRAATKMDLEMFADDMMRAARGEVLETLELGADDAARLKAYIEFAEKGGFDLRNLIATAGSKEAVLSRLRWVARVEKAAELGVDLSRDRAFITETMQFMKEQWLGPNPAFVGTNFLDNSVKALMHDFYPAGDYATRFGEYGTTMPGYVHETLARRGMALEAETVTGRLGIPLISKPEWWLRGYAIETIEKVFGKRASQPIVKFLGKAVDYTKRPDLKGLGKAIAWGLDYANLESVILAGQKGWNVEYAFRAEGVLHKAGGIVETARPEFADDLYKAITEAGFPETEAIAVRDGILSRLIKSPDDVGRVLQRLYPEGEIPVYGLADYPVQYSGKLGEVLGWLRTNLERIEKAGRVTPDAVSAQFDDALRVGQGVIDDVTKVAEGELPVSQVLGGIEDIIAIQGARRDVAVHRLGSLMNKVERAVIEGELPQNVLDDAIKARNKSIFRGRKLIQSSLKKSENARKDMIVEPLQQLAKDLRAGKIDQAQFAIRYSQLVSGYKGYSRPLWDKANDDFVRMISAGIDRIQNISKIYEEPLSLEIAGKLARTEAIMKNIKATFREQVLGEWIDDATKLTDEVGRWKEWSLAKLVPEERVAEAVGAEVAGFQDEITRLREGLGLDDEAIVAFARDWDIQLKGSIDDLVRKGRQDEVIPYVRRELQHAIDMRAERIEVLAPEVTEAIAPAVEPLAPAEAKTRVAQLIEQFGGRWQTMVDDAIDEGIQYSKDIFFDYGQQMAFEEKARWWSPFIHWQILNPFYWLKHAGEMPWIPNAVRLYEWETDQHRLERGLPARFRWTVEAPLHDWMPQFFPEGYYGVDFRPFMSILTQLGIFSPYKEPFRYAEEDDFGKLLRAGEWIGAGTYTWWAALEAKITTKETPDMADLFPITRAMRDVLGIDLGHITDIEDYYAKLELAARVSGHEIDEWTAKRAIMEGAGNPEYDSALEESQTEPGRKLRNIRQWLPFTIKFGSPGELAIREELKQRAGMAKAERPEPSAALSTYFFIRLSPEERENAIAYEAYINRINEMNKYLSAQAQMYGIGTKRWEDITGRYWDDRDRVRSEYEEAVTPGMTDTMRRVLAAPADRAVTSYRKLTRAFFDEEGNLKEGYEWDDLFSAQEKFKRELVRGSSARNPVSLLGFEQAYYKWEIPEEATLRSWERLYATPVYEVINSTKELDANQRNALIADAKRIANDGRKNTAELEADIIRIHPDWDRDKIKQALKTQLPTWDAWARRNQPLRDALESVLWSGYWDLDDLARKQFREFIRTEPDIDPRIATIFEEIILPKEIEKAQVIWKRDMKLVSAKVLLILADRLGTLVDLQREGFQKEIEAAEREEELQPIEREEEPVPTPTPEPEAGRPPGKAMQIGPPMREEERWLPPPEPTPPGIDTAWEEEVAGILGYFPEWLRGIKGTDPISKAIVQWYHGPRQTDEELRVWWESIPEERRQQVLAEFEAIDRTRPEPEVWEIETGFFRALQGAVGFEHPTPRGFKGFGPEAGRPPEATPVPGACPSFPERLWTAMPFRWPEFIRGLRAEHLSQLGRGQPFEEMGVLQWVIKVQEMPWPEGVEPGGSVSQSQMKQLWLHAAGLTREEARQLAESELARQPKEKIDTWTESAESYKKYGYIGPGGVEEYLLHECLEIALRDRFGVPPEQCHDFAQRIFYSGSDVDLQTQIREEFGPGPSPTPEARGRPPGKAMPMPTGVGVPPPTLPQEEPPPPRYGERAFVPPGPAEEAEYDQAQTEMQNWVAGGKEGDWTPLMQKFFGKDTGPSPAGLFWEFYWAEIPPGPFADEARKDPIIEMLLNKAFRTVYDVKEGVYEQALETLQAWRKAHPEVPGDPKEWAIVRQITAKYWELKNAGATNEATALWRYFAALLEKYYPSQRQVAPTRRRYRRRGGGGGRKWKAWSRWRRWPKIRYYPRR